MKKLIAIIAVGSGVLLGVTGCGDNSKALRQVTQYANGGDVAIVPEQNGMWLVRKPDGSVWCVTDFGILEKPHDEILIFKANK